MNGAIPEVIIIGAGAAGLMAAHILTENKINVLVLEAKNRTGGRIHTFQPAAFSAPIEAGAEFIHGKRELTLQLAKQAGLHLAKCKGATWKYEKGQLKKQEDFITDWDKLLSKLKELQNDMPVEKFLKQYFPRDEDRPLRESVTGFVEGYDAADISTASSFALRREWTDEEDGDQLRISEGYHALINNLQGMIETAGGRILKEQVVSSINWAGDKVIVSTQQKTWTCSKVIVTVPLGVLRSGAILFTPELPVAAEFSKIGFGSVAKIIIEFNRPFWKDSGTSLKNVLFLFSGEAVPTWWTQAPDERLLLTGWLAGKNRDAIAGKSPEEILSIALVSLEHIFGLSGGTLREIVSAWYYKDWKEDPFSKGAYAYATTETAAALSAFKHPLKNKLFFAGEAFYEGPAMGTVDAALISGREVALKV